MRLPLLILVLILCTARLAAAQSPAADDVSILLAHSEVEDVLGSVREGVGAELAGLEVAETSELQGAMDRHLSLDALLPLMRSRFEDQGDASDFAAAALLIREGALGRAEAMADSLPPATSLEVYAEQFADNPPPRARIQLAVELAAAQSASVFFVMLTERLRAAAHRIAAEVAPETPSFEPLSEADQAAQAEAFFPGAVVSFLYQYGNLTDDVLAGALQDWKTEAGAWYVQAYSLALGETIALAAENVRAELQDLR